MEELTTQRGDSEVEEGEAEGKKRYTENQQGGSGGKVKGFVMRPDGT